MTGNEFDKIGYGHKKRWLAAGMALVMTAAAVCGCGSGAGGGSAADKEGSSDGTATDGNSLSPEQGGDGAAMGRYLEEETKLTDYLEGYRNHLFRLSDGSLVISEPMQQLLVSKDNGVTWEWEENDWLSPLIQDNNYITSIDFGADGTKGVVYTYMDSPEETAGDGQEDDTGSNEASENEQGSDDETGTDETEDAPEDDGQETSANDWWITPLSAALVVRPDGTQISVELPAAEEDYPEHIWIADNGRVFLGTYGGNVLYEVKEDGSCDSFLTLDYSPQYITFLGNRMVIDGYEFESLLIYDMDAREYVTDEVLDTFVKENYADRTFNGGSWCDLYFFPGGEDVIYLAGDKGVHRHVIGGGAMELIIDASLSSFGNPAQHLLSMIPLENNEFMAIFQDARLVRYVYDPTVPTVPNETVRAYSLTDNSPLRQAISRYQSQNPEVYVEYEIGMEEGGSVTREDALKKLNTQIMAGEGPDFLILNDMPVDAYIEKGLLMDVAPLIDSLEGEEKLFDNIVNAFRKDGKIYTVPCDVNLPMILCREKYLTDIQDLEDIADAVESLRADNPEKDLFRVCSEKGIMRIFSVAYAPAWKTEDGGIDAEAIRQFLIQTKRIYDAQMDGLPQETVEEYESRSEEFLEYYGTAYEDDEYFAYGLDDMNYTMGFRQFLAGTLGGPYSYSTLTSVPRTKGFEDCVSIPMDGEEGSTFCVHTLAGISAASENKERAQGLLKTLLGPEGVVTEGFSVNEAAFEDSLYPEDYESPDEVYSDMAYVEEDGTAHTWQTYWFTESQADELRNRIKSVSRAYVEDSVLEEAVYKAGIAYMRGEMSVEEAVADVEKSMALYLAE